MHWSAPNTSPGERRLLINSYTRRRRRATSRADSTGSPLYGTPRARHVARVARRTAGDMPMPPDFSQGYTSIYEVQAEAAAAKM